MASLRIMRKEQFQHYKKWLSNQVEGKREKGSTKEQLDKFIVSVIAHQRKYVFTGKQIGELMKLSEDPFTQCKQCKDKLPKEDVLETVDGPLCESCMEV